MMWGNVPKGMTIKKEAKRFRDYKEKNKDRSRFIKEEYLKIDGIKGVRLDYSVTSGRRDFLIQTYSFIYKKKLYSFEFNYVINTPSYRRVKLDINAVLKSIRFL